MGVKDVRGEGETWAGRREWSRGALVVLIGSGAWRKVSHG
jgi:hypothetical protein